MQQSLPRNLLYNDLKPIGFPSHVRQEKYTPIAFNTSTSGVQSSDIIRFNISTNGFWDPYSAYIKIEVDVSQMDGIKNSVANTLACGVLQVDNSASSFISQLVIFKGGVEIERIEEYDTLAAILNDMNCDFFNRTSRYFEGMYAQLCPSGQQYSNPDYLGYSGAAIASSQSGTVVQPVRTLFGYSPNQVIYSGQNSLTDNVQANSIYINSSSTGLSNRYEYFLTEYDGKNGIQYTGTNNLAMLGGTASTNLSYGYVLPFNQNLSSFGNEAILSNNVYSNTFFQGISQSVITNKQTFCIPLISGLLGILMPKESYKYIPMKSLQELILEFRLNPYAMFTSGYADGLSAYESIISNSLMGTSSNPMLSRIWKITKFEINVEVQYFEPAVENIILGQLNTEKGIVIHTNSWQLGPRYQISAGTTPNGTYQINLGFESLKNVIWVYIPDEFTTYTFCRKQYRLSANLTSLYVKVGSEYYPPLPVTGHGGTCGGYSTVSGSLLQSDGSNCEFMVQLFKSFGKFNDIQQNCIVNPVNFAVNGRVYNPTNTTAFTTGNAQTNFDTANGQTLFHENRCVGRAIYALNLETLNQDYSVISGINTINNRPFEITLKSDQTNAYARSYTMYVFCQYDMLIQLRSSGVQILGRG